MLVIPGNRVRVVPVAAGDSLGTEYAVYVDDGPAQDVYAVRERAEYFALGFALGIEYAEKLQRTVTNA